MIKFFRKIKHKLLSENKFSKYLIYAIGEVILVVIGILIALQVNNLNEQHKSDKKKYLTSMRSELLTNLELVKTEVGGLDKSINGQRKLISIINSEKDNINDIQLSKILALSFSNVFELKYQDGTFKELLYSGGLILINNDSIRKEITSWEGRMIDIRKQEKGVYDAREKITDFMINNGVFKIMMDDVGASSHYQIRKSIKRTDNKLLLKSQKFENLLSYHIALNESQKSYYLRLENDINDLLKLVEKELNKNE